MRRRNHYGYGAYRGRSKFRTFLKFVIAVLAVVLALLVGGLFLSPAVYGGLLHRGDLL